MAHIQYALGAMGGSNVTSSPGATGSAVGSGDAVVGSVAWTGSGGSPTITDDKGNSYTILDSKLNFGPGDSMATFYRFNITNGPSTIKASWGSAISFPEVSWDEYSGGLNAVDGHAINGQTNPGTGTDAITSGSISPTGTNDVVWGTCVNNNGQITRAVGTGYTLTGQDSSALDWGYISEGKTFGPGTTAATFTDATNGSANTYVTAVVALTVSNTFTASLSESASAVDTVTETMTATASLSESGSAADHPTEVMTASWTLTEAGSAADHPTAMMTASFTLAEAGSAADSPSGLMTASWTIAESDSATDNLSIPFITALVEAGNAIDTLTFTLVVPPPVVLYGIYQPKDLQHAIQWWFQAQQALQQALQNGDPSQIPQLMRQIRRWVGMINALRLAQSFGVKSEATRQKLMYCAPIWPNLGEN